MFVVVLGGVVQYAGLGVVRDGGLGRGVVWRARDCGVDGRTFVVCGTRRRGVVLGLVGFGLGMAVVEGFLLITYSVKQKYKKTTITQD